VTKSNGTPVCVTGDQLAALLGAAETPATSKSVSSSGAGNLTNSGNPDNLSGQDANSSSAATPLVVSNVEPPVIQINGENPAHVTVGATYQDLGAIITAPEADKNLAIKTFLNGALVSDIVLDTSAVATDTVQYVATDPNGLPATSTRTVLIETPAAVSSMSLTTFVGSWSMRVWVTPKLNCNSQRNLDRPAMKPETLPC
jgi:hypothetical protein